MTTEIPLIYSPFPDIASASAAAHALLEARHIACANIIPAITSIYRWEGAIATETEVLLLAKTTVAAANAACEALRSHHPYDVPAILQLPHTHALADYAGWVAGEVGNHPEND